MATKKRESARKQVDRDGQSAGGVVVHNQEPTSKDSASERRPGRPRAKHSDKENYAQMSLYIRRDIRNRTKVRLFEQDQEFSALVEGLLEEWLEKQEQQ